MYCTNEAAPHKALCEGCLEEAQRRRTESSLLPSQRMAEYEAETPVNLPPHFARFLSACIDLVLLTVVSQITSFIAFKLVRVDVNMLRSLRQQGELAIAMGLADQVTTLAAVAVASYAVPAMLYNILFEVSPFGATPGKIILGLGVQSRSGEILDLDQAIRRFAVKGGAAVFPLFLVSAATITGCGAMRLMFLLALVGFVVGIVTAVNPLFILFTREREALHDMIAGSRVVKRQDAGWVRYGLAVLAILFLLVLSALCDGLK